MHTAPAALSHSAPSVADPCASSAPAGHLVPAAHAPVSAAPTVVAAPSLAAPVASTAIGASAPVIVAATASKSSSTKKAGAVGKRPPPVTDLDEQETEVALIQSLQAPKVVFFLSLIVFFLSLLHSRFLSWLILGWFLASQPKRNRDNKGNSASKSKKAKSDNSAKVNNKGAKAKPKFTPDDLQSSTDDDSDPVLGAFLCFSFLFFFFFFRSMVLTWSFSYCFSFCSFPFPSQAPTRASKSRGTVGRPTRYMGVMERTQAASARNKPKTVRGSRSPPRRERSKLQSVPEEEEEEHAEEEDHDDDDNGDGDDDAADKEQ